MSSPIPKELKYTEDHEWVKVDGDTATVGITDHAQSELGDIIFIEFPETNVTLHSDFTITQKNNTISLMKALKNDCIVIGISSSQYGGFNRRTIEPEAIVISHSKKSLLPSKILGIKLNYEPRIEFTPYCDFDIVMKLFKMIEKIFNGERKNLGTDINIQWINGKMFKKYI